MKHFYLKFNHGVEIGARLAYLGHYARTGDRKIFEIACEEFEHQKFLREMLQYHGQETCNFIDGSFAIIGNTVAYLCKISPKFMLNIVASSLEMFAVFSYNYLASKYPKFKNSFLELAKVEREHQQYFKELK